MTPVPTPDPAAPAALTAFLRGVERRAALFAELQCGDALAGDAALAAATRAFRGGIDRMPLALWPQRFWGLLLATPQLRRQPAAASWDPEWGALAALGNGPRAALLLRMLAGLDADAAAAALAVAPATYRLALQRALPHGADGQPDPVAWRRLDAALQRRLKALPAQRLAQLAQVRERALSGMPTPPRAVEFAADEQARAPRWVRATLWLGLLACLAAFAATFFPDQLAARIGAGGSSIRSAPLPPAEPPAARFDADLAAFSHRDFALLADPDGLARAGELAFLAWHAAELAAREPAVEVAATGLPGSEATLVPALAQVLPPTVPVPPPAGRVGPLPASVQAQLARLPPAMRPGLQAQARVWFGWGAAERAAFERRRRQWDALPPAARGAQRERYAAWQALDPGARAQVDAARNALATVPAAQQQAWRQQFEALDASSQRGWLLGPALGADYPKLQPLLAQVAPVRHAPLLAVLRAMTPAERADLAVLAQRVPPQERDALLRTLLSTSAANRAAWLRLRLEQ